MPGSRITSVFRTSARKTEDFPLPSSIRKTDVGRDVFFISGRRKSEDIRLQFSRRRKTSSSIPSSGRRLPTSRRFPAHLPARLPSRRLPAFPPRLPAGLPARLPAGLPGPWLAELGWIGLAGLTACPSDRRPPAFPPSFPPASACLPARLPPGFLAARLPAFPAAFPPACPARLPMEGKKEKTENTTHQSQKERPPAFPPGPGAEKRPPKVTLFYFLYFQKLVRFWRARFGPVKRPWHRAR